MPSRRSGLARNSASILDRGKQILFALKRPLSYIYSGLRKKRSGHEADHSHPSGHEVKKEWKYISISLHASTTRIKRRFLHSVPSFLFRLEADDRSRIMSLLHSDLLLLKIMAGQYAAHWEVSAVFLHLNSFSNEI